MTPVYIAATCFTAGAIVGLFIGLRAGGRWARAHFFDDMIRAAFLRREREGTDLLQ